MKVAECTIECSGDLFVRAGAARSLKKIGNSRNERDAPRMY